MRLAISIVAISGILAFDGFTVVSCIEARAATTHCETLKRCRHELAWQRHDRANLRHRLAARYQDSIDLAFRVAETVYGMPRSKARVIGGCESHLDPYAYNSQTASGVMQLLRSTFGRTPYRGLPIFSPMVNILAAGWIWRQDGGSFREWSCSSITGVR